MKTSVMRDVAKLPVKFTAPERSSASYFTAWKGSPSTRLNLAVGQPYRAENSHFIFYCCQRVILQHISKTMAATSPIPPISFISSEDIELSQEERITLAHARWNEASAANENPSQAKLARQYEIPSSTL